MSESIELSVADVIEATRLLDGGQTLVTYHVQLPGVPLRTEVCDHFPEVVRRCRGRPTCAVDVVLQHLSEMGTGVVLLARVTATTRHHAVWLFEDDGAPEPYRVREADLAEIERHFGWGRRLPDWDELASLLADPGRN